MRVPHTIPKVVLKAYARNLNEDDLLKSYEGRLFRSEDAKWDENAKPSLRDTCLVKIIEDYVFYVKLVEELNRQKLDNHEKQKGQWEQDLSNYLERKASYERKKKEQEEAWNFKLDIGDDPNDADDDDEDDEGRPIKKGLQEPDAVAGEFSEFEPIKEVLDQMWDEDRIQTVEELDFNYIPIEIAVKTIPDDHYWERAANEKWDFIYDAGDHNNKWRQLFLERTVWESIERFHPVDGDLLELQELLDLVGAEIMQLRLDNLIPNCFGTPRKQTDDKLPDADFATVGKEEDEGFGDGEEDEHTMKELTKQKEEIQKEQERLKAKEERKQKQEKLKAEKAEAEGIEYVPEPEEEPDRDSSDHVNFCYIIPKFTNLKVVSLVYELQEMGLEWEPRLFEFTNNDCLNLANALAQTPSIEIFELLRSRVNDEQCKTLIREGLIKMPHLKRINLSYNRISDAGARAVARLLTDDGSRAKHTIHTIQLARNRIHNRGGKALAWALTKNQHLTHLDLRVNRMGDPAGRDFGHALVKNKALLVLLLGSNFFTEETAYVFNKMLFHSTALKELDIGVNQLMAKGGELIVLGVRGNPNILRADVRLSGVSEESQYDLGMYLKKNRNRIQHFHSLIDKDDTYPNEVESGLVAEGLAEPIWSDEEDEEDDEDEEEEDEGDENEDGNGSEEGDEHIEVLKSPEPLHPSLAAM